MGSTEIRMEFEVIVTDEDIDDIMVSALEGGINHWCGRAEVVGKYLGEYGSDQISRGGTLKLHDIEDGTVYELTKEKFLKGLTEYLKEPTCGDFLEFKDHKLVLDTCYADADVADSIIQYAVFGEIVLG